MFDPNRPDPSLVIPGDYIRFMPIDSDEEYLEICEMSANGDYEVQIQ